MSVRVNLAGRLEVEADGRTLDASHLPGRQGRVALAYLIAERDRPVPSEELAEVVWGPVPPTTWRPALRSIVSRVRDFLEALGLPAAELLTSSSGCYQLTLPGGAMVDLELAADDADRAERALATGDLERALAAAGSAHQLAGQQLLPGEEGPWLERRRTTLHEVLVRSLEVLTDARLAAGKPAVPPATELVALEPFRDSAHLRLLRAHTAAGNRGEALLVYDRCRRLLAEELGVGPSPELEAAYLDLLKAEAKLELTLPARQGQAGWVFAGRVNELGRLRTAWAAARAGQRRIVLLSGEAGIGKSALAAELARQAADERATVLHGHCDEQLGVTYLPVRMALGRHLAACSPAQLRALAGPRTGELARLLPELAGQLPELPAPTPGRPETERYLLFEAVTELLEAIAADGPVLLVLEDLHWADEPTLLLLRHLARATGPAAWLIVTTQRDDTSGRVDLSRALADLLRDPGVERLILTGLDTRALTVLARAAADRPLGPHGTTLAQLLRERTGGNPFFVGELLRHLAETGALAGPDAALTAAGRAADAVPDTLRLVVGQRLDRLGPATQDVLGAAAVLGRRAELGLMARVVDLDQDELVAALGTAVRAKLLDEQPDSPGRYAFHHALVRSLVYSGLPAAGRARLHHRAGEALEAAGSGAAGLWELADHFALGETGDAAKAFTYACRAGRQSLAHRMDEEAAYRFQQAIMVMERGRVGDDVLRLDLLLAVADAWTSAGQAAKAAEAQLLAVDAARATGLAHHLARAALDLGGASRFWSPELDPVAAAGVVGEALTAIGEQDSALRALLLARLAGWHAVRTLMGASEWAEWPTFGEAVDLARRLGDRRVLAAVLADQGHALNSVVLGRPGGPVEAARVGAELDRLAGDVADDRIGYGARWARVEALLFAGDLAALDRLAEHEERAARERPVAYLAWMPVVVRTVRAVMTGDFRAGERLAGQVLDVGRGQVGGMAVSCHDVQLVFLRWLQGDPGALQGLLDQLILERPASYPWHRLRPLVNAWQGREAEARRDLQAAAATGFADRRGAGDVVALVMACAMLGDAAAAARLYQLLLPWRGWHLHNISVYLGAADHHLGMLAATTGRWDDASRHLQVALGAHHRLGARPWTVLTMQAFGATLRARGGPGDHDQARRFDNTARAAAAALGMGLPGWGRPTLGPRPTRKR